MIGYGIDLSHHQNPEAVPWKEIGDSCQFVIARATYGATRDRQVLEHVRRARQVGCSVGLYHFFRISIPIADQLAAFLEIAQQANISDGDIIPTIDVEADPIPRMQVVDPSWDVKAKELRDHFVDQFGACMVYITAREWSQLGKPQWVKDSPLWVAHYTTAAAPATPGNTVPTIWQHRVGPFAPNGGGGYDVKNPQFDQNRLMLPLPKIGGSVAISDDDRQRIQGLIALTMLEADRPDWPPAAPDRMRYA